LDSSSNAVKANTLEKTKKQSQKSKISAGGIWGKHWIYKCEEKGCKFQGSQEEIETHECQAGDDDNLQYEGFGARRLVSCR
jgi:hypothetical protein